MSFHEAIPHAIGWSLKDYYNRVLFFIFLDSQVYHTVVARPQTGVVDFSRGCFGVVVFGNKPYSHAALPVLSHRDAVHARVRIHPSRRRRSK